MRLYTIGFAHKTAEEFFSLLMREEIQQVVDIRLNNVSQMAGFTKKGDLKYFLRVIGDIDYLHLPILAPTKEILDNYRGSKDWEQFEERFTRLLDEVKPLGQLDKSIFTERVCCLLCSEPEAERCHRRLVAEYISKQLEEQVEVIHL